MNWWLSSSQQNVSRKDMCLLWAITLRSSYASSCYLSTYTNNEPTEAVESQQVRKEETWIPESPHRRGPPTARSTASDCDLEKQTVVLYAFYMLEPTSYSNLAWRKTASRMSHLWLWKTVIFHYPWDILTSNVNGMLPFFSPSMFIFNSDYNRSSMPIYITFVFIYQLLRDRNFGFSEQAERYLGSDSETGFSWHFY